MSYHLATMKEEHSPVTAESAVERLYDRVVRDLFARAMPGVMVLAALATSVTSLDETSTYLKEMPGWMWLAAFGVGWLLSFALLAIGRRFNLVVDAGDSMTADQHWAAEERFRASASGRQLGEYQRLVTAREATAAGSVSMLLALGIAGVDFIVDVHLHENPWSEIRNGAVAILVLIGLAAALQLTHREYARRARSYLDYRGDRSEEATDPSLLP
jgi:hypothetical protein